MFGAREWASRLQNGIEEHDHHENDLLAPKYFSRLLMTYEQRFRALLGMQSTKNGHTGIKTFSFTKPDGETLAA